MCKLEVLSFSSDTKQQNPNEHISVNTKKEAVLKKMGNSFPVTLSLGMYSPSVTYCLSSINTGSN